MKSAIAALVLGALAGGAAAKESSPAIAPTNGTGLVLNGEATRTVWGFEVYKIRLYLHEVIRDAEKILGATEHPKRIQITMCRPVDEDRFTSTVQQSIDNNFTPGEKEKFAAQLSEFLGCFNKGADLAEGDIITIDYVPADGTVVRLDGRILDTIPGGDFYHALLRLWIGKPLQKSIKDGLVGTAG